MFFLFNWNFFQVKINKIQEATEYINKLIFNYTMHTILTYSYMERRLSNMTFCINISSPLDKSQ